MTGLQVSNSNTGETSKKGLYALAALLRNNVDARRQFYQNNGIQQLTDMLNTPDQPQPVKLKIVNLITDLSELDLQMQVSMLSCCMTTTCKCSVETTIACTYVTCQISMLANFARNSPNPP